MEMYQRNQWLPLKLKIAICSSYMFIRHKIKQREKTQQNDNSCSHGWVCEVLWEKVKGCTRKRGGNREGRAAQLEDLLIALADRRSFPETRFFVARGIVGETWSTESVAVVVAAAGLFPASVLTLPVKEPGRETERDFEDEKRKKKRDNDGEGQVRQHGRVGSLCDCCLSQHALSCTWLLPQPRLPSSLEFHPNVQCKRSKDSDLSLFDHLNQ